MPVQNAISKGVKAVALINEAAKRNFTVLKRKAKPYKPSVFII